MTGSLTPSPGGCPKVPAQNQYLLRIRLPGVAKEDMMVAFLDGFLEIHGLARTEREEEAPGFHYYEAEEIVAHHRVPLPADADSERAVVTVDDGEVLVEIPRLGGGPQSLPE